jgi:hypothetical protein
MPDRPRNVGASVRQRLLNLAHARGQPLKVCQQRKVTMDDLWRYAKANR